MAINSTPFFALDQRMHPFDLLILDDNLIPEEVYLFLVLLTDEGQILLVFFYKGVEGVLQVLALGNDDRVIHLDLLLRLCNQDTGGLTPGAVYQRLCDGLHGGDAQILYIAGHDPFNGRLGDTGFLCKGLIIPLQMVPAKVTPFTPALNGHGKEIGTVTDNTDLGTAYADVIGLLFQGFGGKGHFTLPLISSVMIWGTTYVNTYASYVMEPP